MDVRRARLLPMPSTAHHRAGPAISAETARFFDLSHDLLATTSPDGCFRRVNGAWKDLMGYSESALVGRSLLEFVGPDDLDRTRAALAELSSGRTPSIDFENHFVAEDGSYRWLRWNAHLDGHVVYVVARDVSDQRALSQSLANERAYNRGLIEASIDGLVTVDHDLRITDVNETMCRMVGCDRETLIGSSFDEHFLEPHHAVAGIRRAFAQGTAMDYTLTRRGASGRLLPVSFNVGVYRDAADDVAGVLATARDVTVQAALQQRLQDAQFYTRSLIEASVDPMMTIDSSGVIMDVNRQMELLTQCQKEALIGSPFRDYVTDPDRADRGIVQTLRDGSVTNLELTVRAIDGHTTIVSYNATTFTDAAGAVQGVFATARDVTEFKQLEHDLRGLSEELVQRVLRRTQELEAANRELEAFSYSVSHDLRAPLRSIDGFGRVLERRYGDQLDEGARETLARIRNATARMGTLIDALLELSRLSRRELRLERVDVTALARQIEEELRARESDRQVEVVVEDGLVAIADPTLTRTALANLLENAWKFTGGRDDARIEVASTGPQGFVVRDNGAGFDMAYADKLFVPFERLHRDDEFVGTGIGLTTVERIIHRHGGQLRAEGSVGDGAAFYCDLGPGNAATHQGGEDETNPAG